MVVPIEETTIRAGGIAWDTSTAGEWSGAPVVLLHGFPEHRLTWTQVMRLLAVRGFRVHAPCLPGYGKTTAPDSYAIDDLARQVAAFCHEVGGGGRAHLVGHDWGAMLAAAAAAEHSETIASVALASGPHPASFVVARRDVRQALKSWYVATFQIPGIEHVIGHRVLMDKLSLGVSDVRDPEAMRRALAYYRQNLRPWSLRSSDAGRISVPGLVLHGAQDGVLTESLMRHTAGLFDDLRGFEVLDCGHFIHLERPAEVAGHLVDLFEGV